MTDVADFVRAQLEKIEGEIPPACSEESERWQLHQWRVACRDMASAARVALKAIDHQAKKGESSGY